METLAKEGCRDHKDPVWYCLLHAISYQDLNKEDRDKIYHDGRRELDVELRVNGVEVTFSSVIIKFREIYRQCIEKESKELVDRSVHKMIHNFSRSLEELSRRVEKTVEEAFEEKLGRFLRKNDEWE